MVEKKFQRLMIFQVSLNFLVSQLCLFTFGYIHVTGKHHLRFIDPNYMPQSSQLNSRAFTGDFRIKQYNDQGSELEYCHLMFVIHTVGKGVD